MTDSVPLLGPRGWAALILASGAALSAPFLRNSTTPRPVDQSATGALPQVATTNNAWPDLHEHSLTPPQVATNLTEKDWAELSQLQKISGASPRKVTGDLPSTKAVSKLPAWADRGPRVDQLVNETLRTGSLPPLSGTEVNASLEPIRPWMGDGLKTTTERDSTSQLPNPLNDFAASQPDPDARWLNPTNAPLPNSGATSSNASLVRKFENRVTEWPDESMGTPFFEQSRQVALANRDATRPDVNWPANAGATQPLPSTGVGQIANVQIRKSLTEDNPQTYSTFGNNAVAEFSPPIVDSPASEFTSQPTASVTAPMISSQSAKPIRRPADPSIEATKPNADTQRPKHFIQQPTKRA